MSADGTEVWLNLHASCSLKYMHLKTWNHVFRYTLPHFINLGLSRFEIFHAPCILQYMNLKTWKHVSMCLCTHYLFLSILDNQGNLKTWNHVFRYTLPHFISLVYSRFEIFHAPCILKYMNLKTWKHVSMCLPLFINLG